MDSRYEFKHLRISAASDMSSEARRRFPPAKRSKRSSPARWIAYVIIIIETLDEAVPA